MAFYFRIGMITLFYSMLACSSDPAVPPMENEEEVITDVTLIFTPTSGGTTITSTARDPDGEGPQDIQIQGGISLEINTAYELAIELENTIAGENITEEVRMEANEHLFLFEWGEGAFSNPTGDGNIDNRNDPVNYNDADSDGLPLGLSTNWTTADSPTTGNFRVVLKHQPDLKSSNSDFNTGDTDIDLTWMLIID